MQIKAVQRRHAEPVEFVLDLGGAFTKAWLGLPVYRFGHQRVFFDRGGVLEHRVNRNHIDSNELSPPLDRL